MASTKHWLVSLLAASALTASAGVAAAQTIIQYDDPSDDDGGPAVVYRDFYNDPEPDYRVRTYEYSLRPSGPNGCGTYHFWNGDRCVDARYR
jgi:hypothetical protein